MRRRVPVVLQMSSVECGAACLAMILGYFGRKTPLEECRAQCDPGRDGVTAQTLLSAGRKFGLVSKALAAGAAGVESLSGPCILYWNRSHFVVLERWSERRAEIVDPAEGRRKISLGEFRKCFSGLALRFEPGPAFQVGTSPGDGRLWKYFAAMLQLSGGRGIVMQIAAASLFLQFFGLAVPLLTKMLVDEVLPHSRPGALNLLLLGGLTAAAMQSASAWVRANLLVKLEADLDGHLMAAFLRHLLSLPFRFFQLRTAGDLLMRLSGNFAIREALAGHTVSSILDGTMVVTFLAGLIYFSPRYGLLALALAALQGCVLLLSSRRLHQFSEANMAALSATQSCVVETLMGIGAVKASGAEVMAFDRWSERFARQVEGTERRGRYSAGVDSVMTALRTLSALALLWLGGTLVIDGSLSLGGMLALNGLATMFQQPVSSLAASWQRVQMVRASFERIADVMRAEPEQASPAALPAPAVSGGIELRNVSFRYDTHAPYVLRDVSLSIRPGQKVALVGATGCGKSTLAKLLLGLYQPAEGTIVYDGLDLRSMNLQSLRQKWGCVLQEPFLFHASLRDNIAFQNRRLTHEEVERAARTAEIHQDIERMPMGYETRIDELGQSLSGGQRQRVAIARAVAGEPAFLLLDEATSHLDVATERSVDRNLDALRCTRVVIAHRLSTIQNADVIVLLDDGRIVEQGSHEELMAKGGRYATWCGAMQSSITKSGRRNI